MRCLVHLCVVAALASCDAAPSPAPDPPAPSDSEAPLEPEDEVDVYEEDVEPAVHPLPTVSGSASAAPAASGSSKPKERKTVCVDGAYMHESPAFCVAIPEGYRPTPIKSGGLVDGVLFQSDAKGSLDLQITWLKKGRSVYNEERDSLKEAAAVDPKARITPTRDRRGIYARFQRESGGKTILHGDSVAYKKGIIFWCKAQSYEEPKPAKGFLTACETLMAR